MAQVSPYFSQYEDLEALLAHLKLPWPHRKFVRTTNLIERSFVEELRRTKTLPRCFTEKSCLKLVHATLIRAAIRWQHVSITPLEYERLKFLYQELKITPAKEMEVAAWGRTRRQLTPERFF
jgi:transposase-like protein